MFRVYLKETVEKCPIQETVDFLHSLLGFCTDPTLIAQQTQGQGKNYTGNCVSHELYEFHVRIFQVKFL